MNLHEVVNKALVDGHANIAERQERMLHLAEALPFLPKITRRMTAKCDHNVGDIDLKVPFDVPTIKRVLAQLNELGWTSWDFDRDKTYYAFNHSDLEARIWLSCDFDMEGATCIKKKIGEEEVKSMQPIYEVVCKEGAKESF